MARRLIRTAGEKDKEGRAPGLDMSRPLEDLKKVVESLFAFAYVWAVGGSIASDGFEKFDQLIKAGALKGTALGTVRWGPGTVYDCYPDIAQADALAYGDAIGNALADGNLDAVADRNGVAHAVHYRDSVVLAVHYRDDLAHGFANPNKVAHAVHIRVVIDNAVAHTDGHSHAVNDDVSLADCKRNAVGDAVAVGVGLVDVVPFRKSFGVGAADAQRGGIGERVAVALAERVALRDAEPHRDGQCVN